MRVTRILKMNEFFGDREDIFVFHKILWNVLSVLFVHLLFWGGVERSSIQGMVILDEVLQKWKADFSLGGLYVLNVIVGLTALYLLAVSLVSVFQRKGNS